MNNKRNFAIIAHIDHGKSTLADRFLELTESVEERKMQEQYLDQMDLERERGITIKMQPVTMKHKADGTDYILNLIDTPGHVDFSYEVSRSLAAVEGAILLVDATSGIQAQTVAHLNVAIQQNLKIIPVVNKIDLPQARPKDVEKEIIDLLLSLDADVDDVYHISGKTGEGVQELLQEIIKSVPPPEAEQDSSKPLRALIFDSSYDEYQGVISYIRVIEGKIEPTEEILFMASGAEGDAKEIGVFTPKRVSSKKLEEGDIGYIASGIKDVESARIGDTITQKNEKYKASNPVEGYKEPQAVVFSTIFPATQDDYDDLKDGFSKLKLSDASLYFEPDYSQVLGRGLKGGFLGMLHMEIILERLRREYDLELVVTVPSVVYKVIMNSGEELEVYNPSQYPDPAHIKETKEPWVNLEIIVPPEHMNSAMNLLKTIRGEYKSTDYIGQDRMRIYYESPLADIISDFYDNLKNATSGFGSMSYNISEYKDANIVKLDILLAGEEMPALSRLVSRENAESEGRKLAEKIKEVLPSEQFPVAIQAIIGGKIVARETKPPVRKNVTSGLYGGDFSRKKKQLEKQKKGKKRLQEQGKVSLDTQTLMRIFR